jgi:hypothetical protein
MSEKYKEYFYSDEKKWFIKLDEILLFINNNDNKPSPKTNKELCNWIIRNNDYYNNKKYYMNNKRIYDKFTELKNNFLYKKYFLSNIEKWHYNLELVKNYMNIHKKRPSSEDDNNEIKYLGLWLLNQLHSYKAKCNNMKHQFIYDEFTKFITDEKYNKEFLNNEELWLYNLNKCKIYMDTLKKRPSSEDNNIEIKQIGQWLLRQENNFKLKHQLMSDKKIYLMFKNFMNDEKYNVHFLTKNDKWNENYQNLIKYINENNEIPSYKNDKILYKWFTRQKGFLNNGTLIKNNEYYVKWNTLVKNPLYSKYFIDGYRRGN